MDKLLYVSLPAPEDRVSILKAISGSIAFSPDVDLNKIGTSPKAEGYSGADCAALLREAGLAVLKETMNDNTSAKTTNESDMDVEGTNSTALCICPHHFDYAFDHVVPSVSRKDQARYRRMRDRMAHARSRAVVTEAGASSDNETNGVKKIDNNGGGSAAGATT